MSTTLNFKDKIDLPEWRPLTPSLSNFAAGNCIAYDLRNCDRVRNPYLWEMQALTGFVRYNTMNDAWSEQTAFTTVGGSIGAGSYCLFVPSAGISGYVAAASTSGVINLGTMPYSAAPLRNQFANNGGKYGYKIRVIGCGAGSSGKIEERYIVSSTSGTTPAVTLDVPLTWVPSGGTADKWELLDGAIFIVGAGTTAAGYWKKYEIALRAISGNLSTTNLAATIGTDTIGVSLDEQYVPYDRRPGEGFLSSGTYDVNNSDGTPLKCCIATNSASTTLTGQTASGDASVLANEYRNFQIRIVEDTATPTAVGQRRKITSHTAGPSPEYTVPTWTVTPSATCKYVIELNNDILLFTNAATVTYSYLAGFNNDANWSTAAVAGGATQYANPPAALGAGGACESAFSIAVDPSKNVMHSFIYWWRGANTVTMAYLNIAAGANGVWTTIAPLDATTVTFTTGSAMTHESSGNEGRYLYMAVNATNRILRFDMKTQTWEPWASTLQITQGTAVVGAKFCSSVFCDGDTKVGLLYYMPNTSTTLYNCLAQR